MPWLYGNIDVGGILFDNQYLEIKYGVYYSEYRKTMIEDWLEENKFPTLAELETCPSFEQIPHKGVYHVRVLIEDLPEPVRRKHFYPIVTSMNAKEAREEAKNAFDKTDEGKKRIKALEEQMQIFYDALQDAIVAPKSISNEPSKKLEFAFEIETDEMFYPENIETIQNKGFKVFNMYRYLGELSNIECVPINECDTFTIDQFIGHKFCF